MINNDQQSKVKNKKDETKNPEYSRGLITAYYLMINESSRDLQLSKKQTLTQKFFF